jgi:23S rRNA pseudouridine955/2504/2580 synthase
VVQAAAPKPSAAKGVSLDVRQYRVHADDDGIRLDRWFKRHLPDVSFNIVSRWARTGQLRVDGARDRTGGPDRRGADDPRPARRSEGRPVRSPARPCASRP